MLEILYVLNFKIVVIIFSLFVIVNFKFLDFFIVIERIMQISFLGGGINIVGVFDKVMELFDDILLGKYLEQRVICVLEENVFF